LSDAANGRQGRRSANAPANLRRRYPRLGGRSRQISGIGVCEPVGAACRQCPRSESLCPWATGWPRPKRQAVVIPSAARCCQRHGLCAGLPKGSKECPDRFPNGGAYASQPFLPGSWRLASRSYSNCISLVAVGKAAILGRAVPCGFRVGPYDDRQSSLSACFYWWDGRGSNPGPKP
jgi:hypothetical protein